MQQRYIQGSIFSFFAGSGLLDLGFEAEGFRTVFVNESHKPFIDAYKYARKQKPLSDRLFLSSEKPVYSNRSIESLLENTILDEFQPIFQKEKALYPGRVGFIGGPPCPDFSVGGKNRGKDGENGRLTATYVDLICKMKPDFFILENVKGLLRTKKHRAFFDEQLKKLKKSGFKVRYDLLNSLSFEAPQDRHRVIVFGVNSKSHSNASIIVKNLVWPKVFDDKIVLGMPWPDETEFGENSFLPPPNNVLLHLTVGHWFQKNDVSKHPNASHHFVPRAALPKFKKVREGDTNKKSYKRPHRWRYAPTAAYGNNEVHLHPWLARRMSAAEALAIQSMPKEFSLPPDMTLSNMFKTIGNGVPYLMGRGVAKGCVLALGNRELECLVAE